VRTTISGQEDEVRNRERDLESVTVTGKQQNGTSRKLHYTTEIIFYGGQTYYRSSADKNVWHQKPGMSKLCDNFLKNCWQRGRTKVDLAGSGFHLVGGDSAGGALHYRTTVTKKGYKGTSDVWTSAGPTSYVQRLLQVGVATSGTQKETVRVDTTYGPFNTTLNIQPPGSSA
jgi:hypothetical protein